MAKYTRAQRVANLAKARAVKNAHAKNGWPKGEMPFVPSEPVAHPAKLNRVKEMPPPKIRSSGTPTKTTALLNAPPIFKKLDTQYRPGKVLFMSVSPVLKVRLASQTTTYQQITPHKSIPKREGVSRTAEFKDHRYWADPKDVMALRGGPEMQGTEGPIDGYGTAAIPNGFMEVFPMDDIAPLPDELREKFMGIVSLSEMMKEGSPHQVTGEGFIASMYRNLKPQFQMQACMRKTREIDALIIAHEMHMESQPREQAVA